MKQTLEKEESKAEKSKKKKENETAAPDQKNDEGADKNEIETDDEDW